MLEPIEHKLNKKPLYFAGFLLLICYLAIMYFTYQQLKTSTIDQQVNDLRQHMLFQGALRSYVNEDLKPVFYKLKEQKILSPDFFDPHVLSGTFIAHQVYKNYYSSLANSGLSGWEYKIAAKTPRNPINQASAEELKLLEKFNEDPTVTEFFKVETTKEKAVIYYAKPFKASDASCLRCHGDPSDAPKQLVERYGSSHAFHERIGDIRAFVSYRFDLTKNLESLNQTFLILSLLVLTLLVTFFVFASRVYVNQQKRVQLIQQQQQKLDYVAHHDYLTDLSNRHGLNNDLSKRLSELNNTSDSVTNLWVMMIDIDFFKAINDNFGHDVGDETLRMLGHILNMHTQTIDHAEAYRLGGEEFLLVIPNSNQTAVEKLYQTICNGIASAKVEGLESVIKLSAGATQANREEHQFDLLKRADKALYQAKTQGRERIIVL